MLVITLYMDVLGRVGELSGLDRIEEESERLLGLDFNMFV